MIRIILLCVCVCDCERVTVQEQSMRVNSVFFFCKCTEALCHYIRDALQVSN